MFVKAQVEVPQAAERGHADRRGARSPRSRRSRAATTVFVQTEPGVFVRRLVETGHSFEGFTEMLSGVKAGDVVVTEGSFVLKSEFAKAIARGGGLRC